MMIKSYLLGHLKKKKKQINASEIKKLNEYNLCTVPI